MIKNKTIQQIIKNIQKNGGYREQNIINNLQKVKKIKEYQPYEAYRFYADTYNYFEVIIKDNKPVIVG